MKKIKNIKEIPKFDELIHNFNSQSTKQCNMTSTYSLICITFPYALRKAFCYLNGSEIELHPTRQNSYQHRVPQLISQSTTMICGYSIPS